MRLLAALLLGSGVAWIAGILLANPYLLAPFLPPVLMVAGCYVVVAVGVVLATRRSQLPGRLVALWGLAVLTLGFALIPLGLSWFLVGAAVLYGTIAFGLWVAPPLLVFSFVSSFSGKPGPIPEPATQPPAP